MLAEVLKASFHQTLENVGGLIEAIIECDNRSLKHSLVIASFTGRNCPVAKCSIARPFMRMTWPIGLLVPQAGIRYWHHLSKSPSYEKPSHFVGVKSCRILKQKILRQVLFVLRTVPDCLSKVID